jgi:hypothetical protein
MTKQLLLRLSTPRKLSLFFILTAILMCSSSWAATYYVAPSGNDTSGNGSSTSPWKTLSTACAKVKSSGDTIYLNSGSYTDNNSCSLAAGVKIQGAGQSLVTITSAYTGTAYIYRDTSNSSPALNGNNDISGFTLDGSGKKLPTGILLKGSSNITIHDMTFQHIKTTAIELSGVGNWPDYNTSRLQPPAYYATGCFLHDLTINDCTSATSASTDDRLGAITINAVANGAIYNTNINEAYANHGTGIKGANGWFSNFKIYNNVIATDHANSNCFVLETYNFQKDAEIYGNTFNHLMSLSGGQAANPSLTGNTWNLLVHDNVWNLAGIPANAGNEFTHNWARLYNNYFNNGNMPAAGIWVNGGLTSSGITHWQFDHNVVYNCSAGIFMNSGSNDNINIYNNVFDSLNGAYYGGKYAVWGNGGSASASAIQNNLMIGGTLNAGFSGATINHNWTAASPGITGSGIRPKPYYVPNGPSSNLVGAGINVNLPYTGTAPAIGAYDLSKALTPPTNLTVK